MKRKITIDGMSCGHCVKHVEEALRELQGVHEIKVNLAEKSAIVETEDYVSDLALQEAIEEAGYEVVQIVPLS